MLGACPEVFLFMLRVYTGALKESTYRIAILICNLTDSQICKKWHIYSTFIAEITRM